MYLHKLLEILTDDKLDPFKFHLTYLGYSVVIFTLFIDVLYMCAISGSMAAESIGNPTLLIIIYTSSVICTLLNFYVMYLVLCWLCSLRETRMNFIMTYPSR